MSFSPTLDHLLASGSDRNSLRDSPPEQIIGLLAAGLRTRRAYCLAHIAAVLGSVAGPVAGLKGFLGERRGVDLSLVIDSPKVSLKEGLDAVFLEPLLRYSDLSRLASHSAHRGVLDSFDEEFQSAPHAEFQSEIAKGLIEQTTRLLKEESWEMEEIAAAAGKRRLLAQLEMPSLVITSPAPQDFDRILTEDSLDHRPFILDPDGRIIDGALLQGKRGDPYREFSRALGRYQGIGADLLLKKAKGESPGIAARVRAPFLFHLNGDRLGEALQESSLHDLLAQALLVHPVMVKLKEGAQINFGAIKGATARLREAIQSVILARRNGAGVVAEISRPEPGVTSRWEAYEAWLDGVDGKAREYCLGLYSLPYSLLWSTLVLAGRALSDDAQGRLHVPVLESAESLAQEHVELIRCALQEHELKLRRHEMEDFYRRLLPRAPCAPRQIYRTFKDQRSNTHAKALDGLLSVKAIRYRSEDQKLEPIPGREPPWDLRAIARSLS